MLNEQAEYFLGLFLILYYFGKESTNVGGFTGNQTDE